MAKRLTEKGVESLAAKTAPYIVWDAVATGLGIKVTPRGKRIWVAQLRYPGQRAQTKRTVGVYPALGLAEARAKAGEWYGLVRQGIDPEDAEGEKREQAEQARRAEALKRENTFASVAERYTKEHLAGQRRGAVGAREIRTDLVTAWGDRPIASITAADVKVHINKLKMRAPYQARNAFGHARTLFKWAVHNDLLAASPVASLEQRWVLGGAKIAPRQRSLSEIEIAAFWRGTQRLGYPAGPYYQLLLLTGVRVNELAKSRWSELHPELRKLIRDVQRAGGHLDWASVDDAVKTWTVPRERFKSDAEHVVQLSNAACRIIEQLPRFEGCDFLFTIGGKKPVWLGSKFKRRLDRRMLGTLRALARTRGEDPQVAKLPPWINHDLRRVVRTNLSALDVPDHVAEMVLGHGRRGLQRVYDQHRYEAQIRDALERWAKRLAEVTALKPSGPNATNVVRLRDGDAAMTRYPKPPDADFWNADILWHAERIVSGAEGEYEEFAQLPTAWARAIVEMAKSAKKSHGGQHVTGREKLREKVVLLQALWLKEKLVKEGTPAGAAAEKAAEWAATRLANRNLAASTLKRRMEGARKRDRQ